MSAGDESASYMSSELAVDGVAYVEIWSLHLVKGK